MIVEDERDIAQYLSLVLTTASIDHEVNYEAVDLLEVARWDGITHAIVDLMLPKVSGLQLLEWMLDHVPHVHRIIYSAASFLAAEIPPEFAHVLLKGNVGGDEIVEALHDRT